MTTALTALTKDHWSKIVTALEHEAIYWFSEERDPEHLSKRIDRIYVETWQYNPFWHYRAAKHDLETIVACQTEVANELAPHHNHLQTLEFSPAKTAASLIKLTDLIATIDNRRQEAALAYLGVQGLFLLASASTLLRIKTNLPWAAVANKISIACALVFSALYWFFHRGDAEWVKKQYLEVGREAERRRRDLIYYGDTMEMLLKCRGEYTALYDAFVDKAYDPGLPPKNVTITYPVRGRGVEMVEL